MKKLRQKPAVLAVLLVALYLIGLLLGAGAVCVYPVYYKQKDYFCGRARNIAQEYLDGVDDTLEYMTGPNMHIFIYDAQGTCLRHVTPKNPVLPNSGIAPERFLSPVLAGSELYRPILANETQRELSDIMIVTGVPIWDGGRVAGAVFLVKNLMDLPEAVIGYTVYFTLFYWLSAYFIVSNIRKNRNLEKLRQTYVDNVTHAMKTPIASIKALAETLCDEVEPDPARQKVYCGMILQEANRQHHMIQDALELSKLQSRNIDFTKRTLQAPEILAPVLDKYAALCECMGISLEPSQALLTLPPLYTNGPCIQHMLELLLDNALKFTAEGGHIWMDAVLSKKRAVFCVRDDGAGIPAQALPHIFERFYKVSHDLTESGSGLGLAIAQEIAAGLNEKIWVESELGKGSAFFLTVHLK